jgi:pimeloyl-ACP methyl ester carboxylesterase
MTMQATHTQGASTPVPTRDGRTLHAAVLPGPADAPTVVFEAGGAAGRSSWALVQPPVARFARAVAYDRSGLGRSAPDPAGRTLDRMADDLNDVLDHLEPGPFVLVGHSAGGPIVRLAAARRPDRVLGLVLVDPTDEAADVLFTPAFRRRERLATRAGIAAARVGLLRWAFRSQLDLVPADVAADMRREAFGVQVMRTNAAMVATFLDDLHAWRDDPPDLGTIPVTVISGARPGDGLSAADRTAANASHAVRARHSAAGRHVLAQRSGHYAPLTDADLVVAEIRRRTGR